MTQEEYQRLIDLKDAAAIQSDMYNITASGYQNYNPFVDPVEAKPESLGFRKQRDLGYSRSDFHGYSVADLGCSMGYFSFLALNLGASQVVGVDKDESYVWRLNKLSKNYGEMFPKYQGKLSFQHKELITLPKIPKTDILLVHSLIHWFFVFDRQMTIDAVVDWMYENCEYGVYFEGCIDATEQVMAQHNVSEERINPQAFFHAVHKKFKRVTGLKIMEYNQKRVAVRLIK
jgi:SAM-dependent methyltransferase